MILSHKNHSCHATPLNLLTAFAASSPEGGATPFRLAASRQATFPKGTALAMAGNFAAAPKGVPLGELALRSKD